MQSCRAANAIFSPEIFWGNSTGNPPKWAPKKSIFWTAQAKVLLFFDISRYLTDKYFDIVWIHSPKDRPKKSIFWTAKASAIVFFFFFYIRRYLREKYFDIVWGPTPEALKWTPKYPFFYRLKLERFFFISADVLETNILIQLGVPSLREPPYGPLPQNPFLLFNTDRSFKRLASQQALIWLTYAKV